MDDLARIFGFNGGLCFQVFPNSIANVPLGFVTGGALRTAAGQFVAPNGKALGGFDQRYVIAVHESPLAIMPLLLLTGYLFRYYTLLSREQGTDRVADAFLELGAREIVRDGNGK